jgi:aminopeptidase N
LLIEKYAQLLYSLATTKFQPTYPRRAFPCFDEPAMKAAFRFTLIRHNSFSTPFFNTPLVGSTVNGEWWTDSFIDTPKMSTYLLAYVIANFKSINGQSPRGNSVEIAARPQAIDNNEGKYALNESIIIVDFFEEYFDVDYPLDKISKY